MRARVGNVADRVEVWVCGVGELQCRTDADEAVPGVGEAVRGGRRQIGEELRVGGLAGCLDDKVGREGAPVLELHGDGLSGAADWEAGGWERDSGAADEAVLHVNYCPSKAEVWRCLLDA